MKSLVAAICMLCALPSLVSAQSTTGRWNGKIVPDPIKGAAELTAEQREQVQSVVAALKKLKVTLELRANKTYKVTVDGAKSGPTTNEGTWERKGATLVITSTKTNGKPTKDKKRQSIAISKDGKVLTLRLPDKGAGGGSIVFKR